MHFRQSTRWNLRRAGISCFATLQIGVSAGMPSADAILDGERFGSPIHVESPENTDCAVDHGHLFCQVVRSLSKAGISHGITLSQTGEPPLRVPEPDQAADRIPSTPILFGSVAPRAPPVF